MNLIRSIINFFGFNDAIVDGIGERGMRDSSIIRYNEVHDMYDKIIKDLGDISAYVSKNYIYDKIRERTGLSTKRKKPRYYYRWNYSCSPIRKCPSEVYYGPQEHHGR